MRDVHDSLPAECESCFLTSSATKRNASAPTRQRSVDSRAFLREHNDYLRNLRERYGS